MDHKEYSSGGSEFFPTGQEFSSPQQEFPRLSPEIVPAAAEVDQSGSEFHQSSGPDKKAEKKRRRNISPAMLTTAAVVTAAVIVSPLTSLVTEDKGRVSFSSYPDLELSDQSAAYLSEVWDALPAGDVEQLLSLTLDQRLRTFTTEEVAPYLNMLEQEYGLDHDAETCQWCSGEMTLLESFHDQDLWYDGERVNGHINWMGDSYMFFDYDRYIYDQDSTIQRIGAYFDRMDHLPGSDSFHGYFASVSWSQYVGDTHEYGNIEYQQGLWELEKYDGARFDVLKNGSITHYNKFIDGATDVTTAYYQIDEIVAEGEFAAKIMPNDDPDLEDLDYYVENYLNNGTITFRQSYSDYEGPDYTVRLDVVDGVIQPTDDLFAEYDESAGTYRLYIRMLVESASGGYYTEFVQYYPGDCETEEELFLTSSWQNISNNYYTSR